MYAVLNADGFMEFVEPTIEKAVDAAYGSGAQEVLIDAAGEERQENREDPSSAGRGALKQLRLPTWDQPLSISAAAIEMPLKEAHARLKPLMPPYRQIGPTGIKRDMYPAKTSATLVRSILGPNAKTEKKKGAAENVDVQGLTLTPHWMWASLPAPMGLGFSQCDLDTIQESRCRSMPNLCAGSTEACRHSCLVFSGQNYVTNWGIYSKFQKTHVLFQDPEAFGRVLYEACLRHARNAPGKGFLGAVRLNVLSDIPWELVFPALFERLNAVQFYDYTKVPGRQPPPNYDLTFSNSGRNLNRVRDTLAQGGRVAVVAHIPEWRGGAAPRKKGEQREEAVHRLWSSRLPASCTIGGVTYSVIDGDINDVRFLDPKPSIVALRWKDPTGKAKARAPAARGLSLATKFVVEIEEFCGLMIGAVTPSEQPDTGIETVFSEEPLEAPAFMRRLGGTRRSGWDAAKLRALRNKLLH